MDLKWVCRYRNSLLVFHWMRGDRSFNPPPSACFFVPYYLHLAVFHSLLWKGGFGTTTTTYTFVQRAAKSTLKGLKFGNLNGVSDLSGLLAFFYCVECEFNHTSHIIFLLSLGVIFRDMYTYKVPCNTGRISSAAVAF